MSDFATPPPEFKMKSGGALRFAVGDPGGLRSASWKVQGSKTSRDLYVGSRSEMNELKLSLHKSGVWRLAYTKEWWEKEGLTGNRLLAGFEPPPFMAGNWRRAVSVVIPTANLKDASLRPAEPANAKISWWAPAAVGSALWFEIVVSDGPPDPTSFDVVGKVGELDLPDGSGAMVLVNEISPEDHKRFEGALGHAGWTWHRSDDDGHPLILDTGFPTTSLGDPEGQPAAIESGAPNVPPLTVPVEGQKSIGLE